MKKSVLERKTRERVQAIHQLSLLYNDKVGKNHLARLLELMRKHIDEIEELFMKEDPHAITETGDLLILCLEVILEKKTSVDEVVERCLERYEKKLNKLLDA